MKSLLSLATIVAMVTGSLARGAGRAFPVASENYAIEEFGRINRNIEWDPTNFLVDLSGNYANCDRVRKGTESVDQKTEDGASIMAVFDFTPGNRADVNAVNGYIADILDRWILTGEFNSQIRSSDRFGCSVRPACGEYTVVACLFSPGSDFGEQDQPGGQEALAFTPEQYGIAEGITRHKWDRSHFLENLSGFETKCTLLYQTEWYFPKAAAEAKERGMRVTGVFGSARNRGSTQNAMTQILENFKEIPTATQVGCSIIPDCVEDRGDARHMYVVISCVYEEQ